MHEHVGMAELLYSTALHIKSAPNIFSFSDSCGFAAEIAHHSHIVVAIKCTTQGNVYLQGRAFSLSYTATFQVCQKMTLADIVAVGSNKRQADTYNHPICAEVVCVQFPIAALMCNS